MTETEVKLRKGPGGKPSEPPPGQTAASRPATVEPPMRASGSSEALSFIGAEVIISSPPDHPLSVLFAASVPGRDWLETPCRILEMTKDPLGAHQWATIEHKRKRKTARSLVPVHGCVISMIHDHEASSSL